MHTMLDIHIEEFFIDCFHIMAQLYGSFPSARAVYVEDIAGPDAPDEYGVHSKRFLACFGAMLWLEKENYLRFESTIRQEAIDQATLSEKGLLLLSCTHNPLHGAPEDLQHKPSIDVLRALHKSGTSTQLALAMRALLGQHSQHER